MVHWKLFALTHLRWMEQQKLLKEAWGNCSHFLSDGKPGIHLSNVKCNIISHLDECVVCDKCGIHKHLPKEQVKKLMVPRIKILGVEKDPFPSPVLYREIEKIGDLFDTESVLKSA